MCCQALPLQEKLEGAELISGKVNMVMYQYGWGDGFFHRYSYDAENRLTLEETSKESLVWEKEAPLRKIAPSLFKNGKYTVYSGFKDGVMYIGKTGYTIAQRYAGKVAPASVRALEELSGTIPNNGIAKGVEQLVMELNGWRGRGSAVLSNKNAATVKEVYKKVAERWLNKNVTDWKTLFKFQ